MSHTGNNIHHDGAIINIIIEGKGNVRQTNEEEKTFIRSSIGPISKKMMIENEEEEEESIIVTIDIFENVFVVFIIINTIIIIIIIRYFKAFHAHC